MKAKDRKWLQRIADATTSHASMYRGERYDFVPEAPRMRLLADAFIQYESPHNPVHKDRLVVTNAGLAELQRTAP